MRMMRSGLTSLKVSAANTSSEDFLKIWKFLASDLQKSVRNKLHSLLGLQMSVIGITSWFSSANSRRCNWLCVAFLRWGLGSCPVWACQQCCAIILISYFTNLSEFGHSALLSLYKFVIVFYLFFMCGRGHTCGDLMVT